jgi:hypothetical protein
MNKPINEYYLHDHGDGNGWQVASRGPGRFGVVTTPAVTEHNGVIEMKLTQYIHGMLNSTEESHFMLSPEEAYDLSTMLRQAYKDGEDNALEQRRQKDSCLSETS